MSALLLCVVTNQPLGDTSGLAGGLAGKALTVDPDEKGSVPKPRRLLRRKLFDAGPHLRAGSNSRWKPRFIQAVIDRHVNSRPNLNGLLQKIAQQGKRQKPLRDAA